MAKNRGQDQVRRREPGDGRAVHISRNVIRTHPLDAARQRWMHSRSLLDSFEQTASGREMASHTGAVMARKGSGEQCRVATRVQNVSSLPPMVPPSLPPPFLLRSLSSLSLPSLRPFPPLAFGGAEARAMLDNRTGTDLSAK